MISATLAFVKESEYDGGCKTKSKGRRKVESVGRIRPTYYTCEKRLSGTTWHARTISLITKTRFIKLSSTCVL